ncbi:hypothetical protein DMO32_02845 [Salmonella enterica subsp. salamae]|nr:hypothetical protein [Salmonella enterica subsp. salamae]
MIFFRIRKHNFGVKIDDKMTDKARAGKDSWIINIVCLVIYVFYPYLIYLLRYNRLMITSSWIPDVVRLLWQGYAKKYKYTSLVCTNNIPVRILK